MPGARMLDGVTVAALLFGVACGGGSDVDAGPTGTCDDDMVYVGGADVCVDKYEASEGSAGEALSVANATPWVGVTQGEAASACAAAGRRLCERDEWEAACQGNAGNEFPYGDTYEPESCNGADQHLSAAVPTGSMTDCEGGYSGLFDLSGNVSEWTATCTGTNCRHNGGAFSGRQNSLGCNDGATVAGTSTGLVLGFRCCHAHN